MAFWAPLIGAGISAGGSYLGNEASKNASNKAIQEARRMRDDATGYIEDVDPDELQRIIDMYMGGLTNIGGGLEYTPEMYQFINSPEYMQYQYGGDVMANLVGDSPQMRNAQMAALDSLVERSETGLDAKSKAEFLRAQRAAGEFAQGREGAIINNMQARGMGGSGMEAVLRQMSGQGGADMLSQSMSDQAAADAQQRLNAQIMALNSAGDIRGQDVGVQSSNASILNNMALTNSALRQEIMNQNTRLTNDRIKDNIGEMRRVAGANTDLRNTGQLTNIDLEKLRQESANKNILSKLGADQSVWDQRTAKAGNLANAKLGGLTEVYAGGAADAGYQRDKYGAMGKLGTGAVSAYDSYYKDKEKKELEDKEKEQGV